MVAVARGPWPVVTSALPSPSPRPVSRRRRGLGSIMFVCFGACESIAKPGHTKFFKGKVCQSVSKKAPYKANPLPETPDAKSSSGAPRQNPVIVHCRPPGYAARLNRSGRPPNRRWLNKKNGKNPITDDAHWVGEGVRTRGTALKIALERRGWS